jgi:hypothetical protein
MTDRTTTIIEIPARELRPGDVHITGGTRQIRRTLRRVHRCPDGDVEWYYERDHYAYRTFGDDVVKVER